MNVLFSAALNFKTIWSAAGLNKIDYAALIQEVFTETKGGSMLTEGIFDAYKCLKKSLMSHKEDRKCINKRRKSGVEKHQSTGAE